MQSFKNTKVGQSLIEYALIMTGVALVIISGLVIYGGELREMYNYIDQYLW